MTPQERNSSDHHIQSILFRVAAFSVPVGLILASAFFQLTPFVRQAMVGIVLIWIMLGAFVGYSFLG